MEPIVFEAIDWPVLIAFGVAVLIAFFSGQSTNHLTLYKEIQKQMPHAPFPRPWIYPVVWFFLWLAATAAIFIYWKVGNDDSPYYVSINAIFIGHLAFAWLWTPLFFWGEWFFFALIDLVMAWLTCAALVGLTGYQAAVVSTTIWASFSLFVVYLVWLSFAVYLNYLVWMYYRQQKKLTRGPREATLNQ